MDPAYWTHKMDGCDLPPLWADPSNIDPVILLVTADRKLCALVTPEMDHLTPVDIHLSVI